jgi:hypothetical protein
MFAMARLDSGTLEEFLGMAVGGISPDPPPPEVAD